MLLVYMGVGRSDAIGGNIVTRIFEKISGMTGVQRFRADRVYSVER